MNAFADAFRAIVMPDLRCACRLQALAVARERCSFTEASIAVMAHARSRGATHLPTDILMDLEEWIEITILETIADVETRPSAAPEIVAETLGAT